MDVLTNFSHLCTNQKAHAQISYFIKTHTGLYTHRQKESSERGIQKQTKLPAPSPLPTSQVTLSYVNSGSSLKTISGQTLNLQLSARKINNIPKKEGKWSWSGDVRRQKWFVGQSRVAFLHAGTHTKACSLSTHSPLWERR